MALTEVPSDATGDAFLYTTKLGFSGVHIGGGLYLGTNHNLTASSSPTATPALGLDSAGEPHITTEVEFITEASENFDDYFDDTNNDGTVDFPKEEFDMELYVGERLASTGEFYAGPAAPMVIANDSNDLIGLTATIAGYIGGGGTVMYTDTGQIAGFSTDTAGSDTGERFALLDAEAVGGMSGGGVYVDLDYDGDGTSTTYLMGTMARAGDLDSDGTNDLTLGPTLSQHYSDLADAIQALSDPRTADDFSRNILLSKQTANALPMDFTGKTVQGEFFHEDIFGSSTTDTLYGAGGDDSLFGGGQDDHLEGGSGDDALEGGSGDDLLIGGAGQDTFIIGAGADTISDFTGAEDYINLTIYYSTFSLAELDASDGILGDDALNDLGALDVTLSTGANELTEFNTGFAICFSEGTHILTSEGPRPVEALQAGELILTRDHGFVPLRWIGFREEPGTGRTAPVHVLPEKEGERSLVVSPLHRLLIAGRQTELHFGETEMLAPAKGLINDVRIKQISCRYIRYFHLLFDKHQLISAEGHWAESLHPGEMVLLKLGEETKCEIKKIFPDILLDRRGPLARPALKPREAKLLSSPRISKNAHHADAQPPANAF